MFLALPNSTTLAPTDVDELCVRLMPIEADKSAVCAINRHLLYELLTS